MLERVTNKVTDTLKGSFMETNGRVNVNETERIISVAAGAFMFYKGLTQVFKHPVIAFQEAAVGGYMLYRGATGYCPLYSKMGKDTTDPEAVSITERIIVNSPKDKVYAFWRKFENLPRFMKHLSHVEQMNDGISHWEATIPGRFIKIGWNAEITHEEENNYIGWQSVAGSKIDNAGKVEFKDALNGEGTELNIEINYFPPAGAVGQGLATLLNDTFKKRVREDITNFKHYVEGEEYQTYQNK